MHSSGSELAPHHIPILRGNPYSLIDRENLNILEGALSYASPLGLQVLNARLQQPFLELFHGEASEGKSFTPSAV